MSEWNGQNEGEETTRERRTWLWLAASGITPGQFQRLAERYGGVSGIAGAVEAGADGDPRLRAALVKLRDARRPAVMDALEAAMRRHQIRLVTREEAAFPPLLRFLDAEAPIALFVRGEADLARSRQFAIVGSRRCTRYGAQATQRIAAGLASAGVTVVSGMARGIDTAAHLGSLSSGGCTVAVLGCGADIAYPQENEALIRRVLDGGGAVISEYAPGTPPRSANFPVRNRIISGMCSGLLVAEAAQRSGAMITVRHALAQGREVYALPGPVDSPASEMPLALLREGGAMATSAEDILQSMRWLDDAYAAPTVDASQGPDLSRLSAPEMLVAKALEAGETTFAELVERTGLSVPELNSHLTMLELQGIIIQFPGRIYAPVR